MVQISTIPEAGPCVHREMAHKGYVGEAGEGCGGVVRGPILGPFGPDAGYCLSEPFWVFGRALEASAAERFPNGNGNA